ALNQAFGFQLGVSIRHRGAVDAEHGRKLTAGGNAVALTQIAGVHESAQLVAKLDVQRDVALWLEMKWKHCLSPSANSTRYWPAARANLSFRNLAGCRALIPCGTPTEMSPVLRDPARGKRARRAN